MIDLLDAPLRVSWSLSGDEGIAKNDLASVVAGRLVDAGVFFLTLQDRALDLPALPDVLSTLAAGGCRNTLVCDAGLEGTRLLSGGLSLETVLVDARPFLKDGPDFDGMKSAIDHVRSSGYEAGLLMVPLRSNLMMIPRLLDFCREEGLVTFRLPNVPVFAQDIRAQILTPKDLLPFRTSFHDGVSLPKQGLSLEVHDLFLWEILFPARDGSRTEYGGCQACNSVAHVDASGNLYPCSSWPESLGSLRSHTLTELWDIPRRFHLRKEISAPPPGCDGCREYHLCFGGCRGLSRFLDDTASRGRDPLCSSPR